jgi:hypothetical protein
MKINQKRHRSIHQGDITIVNFGTSKFIKQRILDIKPQIDANTTIVGEFSTLLKAKNTRHKTTDRHQYNNSGCIQYPT